MGRPPAPAQVARHPRLRICCCKPVGAPHHPTASTPRHEESLPMYWESAPPTVPHDLMVKHSQADHCWHSSQQICRFDHAAELWACTEWKTMIAFCVHRSPRLSCKLSILTILCCLSLPIIQAQRRRTARCWWELAEQMVSQPWA